ncbi:MAG TPA: hypothetical protein VM513_28845 [Kofleriaceae bacterium]|jgi:ABC-type transport system involved in multi-copper enzyme maturation permease subunit|nr:hypothetical protein [Kofleriaceae bacterium]
MSTEATPRPAGTIYDLGYKRYAGARRSSATRWRVLMRNQVATAWKTWWRYRSHLAYAVGTTLIAGAVMYIFSERIARSLIGDKATTFADAALPLSIQWYTRAGFLVSLTVGARIVASDIQAGAFTFYFARSVRPRDYIIGKLAGMCVLTAGVCLAGPVLLSIARLGLSSDTDALVHALALVPKAIAIGLLGALVFAAVPMAFSSLLANGRYAVALWTAYYLVFGQIVSGIGRGSQGWIGALDIATSLDSVAFHLFGLESFPGRAVNVAAGPALASLLVHIAVALVIVSVQVRRAQGSGVGGAT